MSFILNIDTAGETGFVSLGEDGREIGVKTNLRQNDHAAFLHPAILELLKGCGLKVIDLSAISVVAGPGSYTGVRIAMATAKGLAYTCSLPLIAVSATYAMSKQLIITKEIPADVLLCPMIDARRDEVFTALYDAEGNEIYPPAAVILREEFLKKEISENEIFFFGSGAEKWRAISKLPLELCKSDLQYSSAMCHISYNYFLLKRFADTALSAPLYVKEFYDKR